MYQWGTRHEHQRASVGRVPNISVDSCGDELVFVADCEMVCKVPSHNAVAVQKDKSPGEHKGEAQEKRDGKSGGWRCNGTDERFCGGR